MDFFVFRKYFIWCVDKVYRWFLNIFEDIFRCLGISVEIFNVIEFYFVDRFS